MFGETAGGVTVSAALALARGGRFRPDDEVVLCITGHGLKTVEAVRGRCRKRRSSRRASAKWRLCMAVTFSLPTILARLADGQSTIDAAGGTLGDVVAEIAGRYHGSRPDSATRPAGRIPSSPTISTTRTSCSATGSRRR